MRRRAEIFWVLPRESGRSRDSLFSRRRRARQDGLEEKRRMPYSASASARSERYSGLLARLLSGEEYRDSTDSKKFLFQTEVFSRASLPCESHGEVFSSDRYLDGDGRISTWYSTNSTILNCLKPITKKQDLISRITCFWNIL